MLDPHLFSAKPRGLSTVHRITNTNVGDITKFDLTPFIDVRAAGRDRFSIPRRTLIFGPRPRIKNINPIADRKIERDDPYCPLT